MPNLTNNMSGQQLIEEVNHSIDERGKVQENGEYGGVQEINGGLTIKSNEEIIANFSKGENSVSGVFHVDSSDLSKKISLQSVFNGLNTLASSPIVVDNSTTYTGTTESVYYREPVTLIEKTYFPDYRETKEFKGEVEFEVKDVVCPNQSAKPTADDCIDNFYNKINFYSNHSSYTPFDYTFFKGTIKILLYQNNSLRKTLSVTIDDDYSYFYDVFDKNYKTISGDKDGAKGVLYYDFSLKDALKGKSISLNGDYKVKISYDFALTSRSDYSDYQFWLVAEMGKSATDKLQYKYKKRYLEPIF